MAQAVRDLMSGDLNMTMPLVTRTLLELHNIGKIKVLAVTSPKRLCDRPDIPTAIEAGVPKMVAAEFFYLFAPAGTPAPVLQFLNDIARAALADAEFKKKLEALGLRPACSPAGSTIRAGSSRANAPAGCRSPKPPAPRSTEHGIERMNDASGYGGLTRSMLKLGEVEIELYTRAAAGRRCCSCTAAAGSFRARRSSTGSATAFACVAPVHPGFGGSSLPIWIDSVDDYAHLYLELIGRLDLSGILLVGHSVGGWTAAELATKSTACDRQARPGRAGRHQGRAGRQARHSRHLRHAAGSARRASLRRSGEMAAGPEQAHRRRAADRACPQPPDARADHLGALHAQSQAQAPAAHDRPADAARARRAGRACVRRLRCRLCRGSFQARSS